MLYSIISFDIESRSEDIIEILGIFHIGCGVVSKSVDFEGVEG